MKRNYIRVLWQLPMQRRLELLDCDLFFTEVALAEAFKGELASIDDLLAPGDVRLVVSIGQFVFRMIV